MRSKTDAMRDVGEVLNQKIVIEKEIPNGHDTDGNPIVIWQPCSEFEWAKVMGLYGKEYFAAKSMGEEKSIKFKIRNNSVAQSIDTSNRVNYGNSVYEVKHIDYLPGKLYCLITASRI